jgi:hypothetical protein
MVTQVAAVAVTMPMMMAVSVRTMAVIAVAPGMTVVRAMMMAMPITVIMIGKDQKKIEITVAIMAITCLGCAKWQHQGQA